MAKHAKNRARPAAIRAYLTQPAIRLDTFAGALAKLAQAIRQEAKP